MYRNTENKEEDILPITVIYNETTGRNRTLEQHQWEWFGSPYKNASYIITTNKNEVIGHHGILSVELDYKDQRYRMGKTENTIIKKGFGPAYPKNEMAMFKEYFPHYNVLMTTAAWGVTRRIREKLGYKYFADYVNYVALIDSSFIATRSNNNSVKSIINFLSPVVNLFLFRKQINENYTHEFKSLDESDLCLLSELYEKVKGQFGFMQTRTFEFYKYRFLDNPYSKFFVMYLYENQEVIAAVIYSLSKDKLTIEDVLAKNPFQIQEVYNRLYNHAQTNKLAKVLIFSTLENSVLDKRYQHFFRRTASKTSSVVMINNNIQDENKVDLTVENFYFTSLTNEGIK
jgi:hypothetical protein